MAEQLAVNAKEHGGIMRFILVPCVVASLSSPSRMLRAKAAAEEAIMREFPEATILKPATLIGTEDQILNRWAQFAKKWSFLPLFGDGSTKIQPVYVVDVAAAIIASFKDDGASMGKINELGGPEVFTMHELAELMYYTIREWPRYVMVPFPIARVLSSPRELLLKKIPFPLPNLDIFNLDQINALTIDTVLSETGGRILNAKRSSMKEKMYEVAVCTKYWRTADERTQYSTSLDEDLPADEEDDDDADSSTSTNVIEDMTGASHYEDDN